MCGEFDLRRRMCGEFDLRRRMARPGVTAPVDLGASRRLV